MKIADQISRFIPEFRSAEAEAPAGEYEHGWYLPLSRVCLLVMERGENDPDLLRRVSDFIEWAYTHDEDVETAATIELLEPLFYRSYGPVGELLEAALGERAKAFLARVRAESLS